PMAPRKREAGLSHLELRPEALRGLKETFERERREAAEAWRAQRGARVAAVAPEDTSRGRPHPPALSFRPALTAPRLTPSPPAPARPARRFTLSPSGLPPAQAKALARRAYGRARAAGSLSSAVVDKLWADTLVAVADQPATAVAEMLRRTEHLFVLIEDRAS